MTWQEILRKTLQQWLLKDAIPEISKNKHSIQELIGDTFKSNIAGVRDFSNYYIYPDPAKMGAAVYTLAAGKSTTFEADVGTGYIEAIVLFVTNPHIGIILDFKNEPKRRDVGTIYPITPYNTNFMGTRWNDVVHNPVYDTHDKIYAIQISRKLPFKEGFTLNFKNISDEVANTLDDYDTSGKILNYGIMYSKLLPGAEKKIVMVR